MRDSQNALFFEQNMVIQYSHKKSNVVAQLDGSWNQQQQPNADGAENGENNKRKASNDGGQPAKKQKTTVIVPLNVPPNKVLFVQNLPEDCSDKMLQPLFQAYAGFKEVRLVPGGKGMAFVEFANELDSGRAMVELQGFRITLENPIYISYRQTEG